MGTGQAQTLAKTGALGMTPHEKLNAVDPSRVGESALCRRVGSVADHAIK